MRRYIIHLILFICSIIFPAFFQINLSYGSVDSPATYDTVTYTPTVDSLLNLIKTASGPELLKVYPRLHKALYEVNDIDVHLKFNTDFAEAARAAKDKKMEGISYMLKVEALYNYRMPDSIMLAEALSALDFMRDVPGTEVYYFYTASAVSDIYMLEGNYEKALEFAGQSYNEAKRMASNSGLVASLQTMGKAYEELGVLDKAEISFRESIAAADERKDHGIKGETYSYLVDMLNGQSRYNEALEVNKEFEEYLKRIDAYNGELRNLCFLNDLGYAATYTKLGQYNLAWEYIQKAEKFPIAETSMGMYSVENERFALLFEEGRYAEAEQSLNRLEDIMDRDASYFKAVLKLREARAELYYRWGKYDKSASIYKEYIAGKDSLQTVEMATRLNTIRTRYEVDKLERQKEEDKKLFKNTIVWFSAVLVLLCVIITIVIINGRRLRAKNQALLARIREQDELEKKNERMRSELASKKKSASTGAHEQDDLYFRLSELMKDPAVFTDSCINRKSIAEKLGTNEKYVFDTIRRYYDMSISEYINNLRLAYARELLANPSNKDTIEAIAIESGFSSRATFHRLFKERNGMTPDDFRRLVNS